MKRTQYRMPIANCQLEEGAIGASVFQIGNRQLAIGNDASIGIWHSAFWHKLHADRAGAMATEYILIMALIVLPLGLMWPLLLNMVQIYATRVIFLMGLSFP